MKREITFILSTFYFDLGHWERKSFQHYRNNVIISCASPVCLCLVQSVCDEVRHSTSSDRAISPSCTKQKNQFRIQIKCVWISAIVTRNRSWNIPILHRWLTRWSSWLALDRRRHRSLTDRQKSNSMVNNTQFSSHISRSCIIKFPPTNCCVCFYFRHAT